MGKGNGSCLLRSGRKTMPGNEVHTCTHIGTHTHTPATRRRHVFAFNSRSHSLSFAVRTGTYVHCIAKVQPGRQAGLQSGFESSVRFGSPIIAAILCHLHRLATLCNNNNSGTSCLRAKLAPVIILCRRNLLRPFVHFILVFYFAVCSLFENCFA